MKDIFTGTIVSTLLLGVILYFAWLNYTASGGDMSYVNFIFSMFADRLGV